MGYTTEFDGFVEINPPLNEHEISFLQDLATTRRMNRRKGPLYIPLTDNFGQNHDEDVIEYNSPHPDQPGLWCQWIPTEGGTALSWDGGEKFYHADAWMKYIVTKLLAPSAAAYVKKHRNEDARLWYFTCDHTVNGEIYAQGEDPSDRWVLIVRDNKVLTAEAIINYGSAQEI